MFRRLSTRRPPQASPPRRCQSDASRECERTSGECDHGGGGGGCHSSHAAAPVPTREATAYGAIRHLMQEHRAIERVLEALRDAARRAHEQPGQVDPEALARALAFLRAQVDGSHHAKEEEGLFGALVSYGMPKDGGALHCMYAEHEGGRRLVQDMERALQALQGGSAGGGGALHELVERYAQGLTAHILREDASVYPLAVHFLPEADLARLEASFEEGDRARGQTLEAAAEAVVAALRP